MKTARESTGIGSLASQSVVYGFGGVLARALGFVLVPIYLHAAGPSAFGTVELMLAAVLFASILLRMGIVVSMSRFTIGETEQREWAPIVHTIFTYVMVAATAGVVIGFLLRGPIGDVLEVSDDIVYAGLFGLWITMNYDVMARVYRIERRARAWVQYTLLNVLLTAVLTVALVVVFDTGALGLLIGNFTGTAIVYLILIVARRETIGMRRFETPVLRELLVFSVPLMPANIALWALNLADRLQVQQLVSHEALGSYSAAARVSMAMAMVMGAFQTAWAPYAHQVRGTEGDEQAKITYARVLTYWSLVMGWGLIGISLVAPPYIRATFPASTWDAIPVVPLLAIGIVLYGCYLIVNIGVTVSRKTRMTPIICTIAAALNIGLNFWFIPEYGIVGAGITTVIGYIVLLWLGWWNAQRSYPVPYNWPRVARVTVVVAGYLAASEWLIPQAGVLWLALRCAFALTFPAALLLVGAVTRPELRRGRELVRQRGWRFWSRQSAAVDSVDELV